MVKELLAKNWYNAGINNGDLVLLHSDIKLTIRHFMKKGFTITPLDILESFLLAVGSEGTLLVPTFNYNFAKGKPFDIRNTASQVGVLTETARQQPLAVRTGHPIFSFVALGYKAELFRGVNNFCAFGKDSPFAMIKEMNGKIAILDFISSTFFHYVEEMHEVSYRYHKNFEGEYTDFSGNTTIRTYDFFVRDLEKGIIPYFDKAEELLWKQGLYKGDFSYKGSGLRTIDANKMYDFASKIILENKTKGLFYRVEGDDE